MQWLTVCMWTFLDIYDHLHCVLVVVAECPNQSLGIGPVSVWENRVTASGVLLDSLSRTSSDRRPAPWHPFRKGPDGWGPLRPQDNTPKCGAIGQEKAIVLALIRPIIDASCCRLSRLHLESRPEMEGWSMSSEASSRLRHTSPALGLSGGKDSNKSHCLSLYNCCGRQYWSRCWIRQLACPVFIFVDDIFRRLMSILHWDYMHLLTMVFLNRRENVFDLLPTRWM